MDIKIRLLISDYARQLKYLDIGFPTGELDGPPAITGSLSTEKKQELRAQCGANSGDLILYAAGPAPCVHRTLDSLRTYLAESLGIIDKVVTLLQCNLLFP